MLKFEDLQTASKEMIEELLEHVDRATLAMSLHGASARLIERVLGGRSAQQIAEVLEAVCRQQAVSLDEIEAARRQVAEMAEQLAAAGAAM